MKKIEKIFLRQETTLPAANTIANLLSTHLLDGGKTAQKGDVLYGNFSQTFGKTEHKMLC